MTTTYPADLPDVPADRWTAKVEHVFNDEQDGMNHAVVTWSVAADNQDQAERRGLAVQHHDYEDELEGARAEGTSQGDRWLVSIIFRPYR
jgi:hypothetical protein